MPRLKITYGIKRPRPDNKFGHNVEHKNGQLEIDGEWETEATRKAIITEIKKKHPGWTITGFSCWTDEGIIPKENIYRLRAECLRDIETFLTINKGIKKREVIMTIDDSFPDTEMEFVSNASIEDVRNELRKVRDGHTMVQTVALKNKYTGKRDYSL